MMCNQRGCPYPSVTLIDDKPVCRRCYTRLSARPTKAEHEASLGVEYKRSEEIIKKVRYDVRAKWMTPERIALIRQRYDELRSCPRVAEMLGCSSKTVANHTKDMR